MKNKETLEEAAERLYPENWESIMDGQHDSNSYERTAFINGAKWQQEQEKNKYSEEYMLNFAWFLKENLGQYSCDRTAHFEGKYLEQFKNK